MAKNRKEGKLFFLRIPRQKTGLVQEMEPSDAPVSTLPCYSGYSARIDPANGRTVACIQCKEGTYAFERGVTACEECMSGGVCHGGNNVTVEGEYWESDEAREKRAEYLRTVDANPSTRRGALASYSEPTFYSCPVEQACEINVDGHLVCSEGYTGKVCGICGCVEAIFFV